MPFIQAPIADATEDELVPEAEYELRIAAVTEKDSKGTGKPMLEVLIEITNPPAEVRTPAPVFHYVSLPHEDDEPKALQYKLRMIRRLLEVFGVAFEDNGFDSDDLLGATGNCLVFQQEQTKEEGNTGKRVGTGEYSHAIRLPKFANEPAEEQQAEGPKPGATRRRR